jgi:hypothetical protein
MTSLLAIFLLVVVSVGSLALLVALRSTHGRFERRIANAGPAVVILLAVFAVYVVAWMLAILLIQL